MHKNDYLYNRFFILLIFIIFIYGTGGGTRTHTPLLTTDFESVSSTNSDTPALVRK